MRVLVVTNDFPPKAGGIQRYLGNLIERFEGDIRVLAPAHQGAPATPGVVRGDRRFMWPSRSVRRWVGDHVEEFRPDVVVFGAPHPLAQMGPWLRQNHQVPYAVMTHGAEVTLPAAVPGLRSILKRTLRQADVLFAVSRFTANRVQRLGATDVIVLGAGVDLDAFESVRRASGGDRLVIGCVSRFVPRKGHVRVITAAEELDRLGTPAEVLIVGAGRLEARIRRRAARASVPVRIEVDVEWSRLAALYGEMDVFAMPARSRWAGLEVEGLGLVFLEAAASGLAVLAGSSGGSPETVRPGSTGYVATSVGELVEGLQLIAPRRAEMGKAARRRAEQEYSWDAVMSRFQGALQAATRGRVT